MEPESPNGPEDRDEPNSKGEPGSDANDADRTDDEEPLGSFDAVRTFLLVAAVVAFVLPIVFALQAPQAIAKVWIAAVGAGIVAAAIAAGALVGFIFGIPTSLQYRRPPSPAAGGAASEEAAALYVGNTSLEQISDWLTKILVGVGLTQLSSIPSGLADLGQFLAVGLGGLPGADVFAAVLVVYGIIIGFFLGYLWTRLNLPFLLAESDLKQLLARAKDKARVAGEQRAFDTLAKKPSADGKGASRPEEPIERESVRPGGDRPRPKGVAPELRVSPAPITALWVDDRPEANDSVRQVMQQRFGVTFENALSTADAINKLTTDRDRYGFLITDMSRPPDRRAGFTLLRQLHEAGIYLPAVIYTGKAVSREFNDEAQRLNAEAITNSPSDLFKVVERLVNRIQMARPGT